MTFNKLSRATIYVILLAASVMFLEISCKEQEPLSPILILASEADFGTYTGEILRTEGYNEYDIKSIASGDITPAFLHQYDIVILSQRNIGSVKGELIMDYVNRGGNLIAFRPDIFLSGIFGVEPAEGVIKEGYIRIDTSLKEGSGLSAETLQFHGDADKFTLKNGRTIATLYTDSFQKSEYPAVVSSTYGKGNTYAFSYNLPESIVYTRQGNPLYAGKEKDGINGLRAMDLFTDGWLNSSKNTLNQADIQMNLLSHCIMIMSESRKPLPRLWYFPDTLKCLVTLTNDGEYRSESDFETQFSDIDSAGAKMTIYILETNKVSVEWVDKWTERGFEISGHPDDTREAGGPGWSNMNDALALKKKEISDLYCLEMKTIVNHWFVWCGNDSAGKPEFAAQAEIEASHCLGLDINYAHYDNGSNQGHFLGDQGLKQGNFTGSGLIMKFAGSSGKIIDIYQHLNNVYDQQYNENHDSEGYYSCFKGLMDRSLDDEAYSFISIKAHNDEYYFSKEPLLEIISYAKQNEVPVWTAANLLNFVKMRNGARFSDIRWRGSKLSFILNSTMDHANGLTIMVPYRYDEGNIETITLNDSDAQFIVRSVKGNQYAFFIVNPNSNHSISVKYN